MELTTGKKCIYMIHRFPFSFITSLYLKHIVFKPKPVTQNPPGKQVLQKGFSFWENLGQKRKEMVGIPVDYKDVDWSHHVLNFSVFSPNCSKLWKSNKSLVFTVLGHTKCFNIYFLIYFFFQWKHEDSVDTIINIFAHLLCLTWIPFLDNMPMLLRTTFFKADSLWN